MTHQIMNITCDNASNNDTMVAEMGVLLPFFEGQFHRVHCFAHVVNLVAKSMLRQFDAKTAGEVEGEADEDVRALLELAETMAEEDAETMAAQRDEDGEQGPLEDDDEWVDEVESLSPEEREQFLERVVPVKLVLAKVRVILLSVCCDPDRGTRFVSWHTRLSTRARSCSQPGTTYAASSRCQNVSSHAM